jgi:replicative DNA helicase
MDLTNLNDQRKEKERRKSTMDLGTMVYGKIPPQSKDLEEAVLGAIMMQRDAFDEAAEILKPESFYVEAHQRIFQAMQNLVSKSQPTDILTVVEELRKMNEIELVGGPYYVTKLTNTVVSSANITHHARIVHENYLKRELIKLGGEMIGDAYEDFSDVFEIMDALEAKVMEMTFKRSGSQIENITSHLPERAIRIKNLMENPQHLTGVPSGFHGIDAVTHGWQKTDLIILAARPAVGKTALALNFARNACMNREKPVPVAFFSLEMSTGQLVDRILSAESEVWLEKIMNGRLDDSGFRHLYQSGFLPIGQDAKIFIDDTPALNVFELRAKARKLKKQWMKLYGTDEGLIIIDYLQLMNGLGEGRGGRRERFGGNREQEISTISRNLKALAKELNIPVIALSQLSREIEKRGGKEASPTPKLSDLRESGAIEQDADVVMFISRPEYYEINANEMGESTKGETHITIAKHRNGKLAIGGDVIKLRADLAIQKFYPWSQTDIARTVGLTGNWKPVNELPREKDDLPFE